MSKFLTLANYRRVYALTYLVYLLLWRFEDWVYLPREAWRPQIWLRGLPGPPSVDVMLAVEALLALALVGLFIGWRIRWMTGLVLLLGLFLVGCANSTTAGYSHVYHFLVVYVPFAMLVEGWNRVGGRRVYLILGVLFVISAFIKLSSGAFTQLGHLTAMLDYQRVKIAEYGLPWLEWGGALARPLLPVLAWVAIIFEVTFWTGLLDKRLWLLFTVAGIGFHLFNGIVFGIWFEAMLIAPYLLFIVSMATYPPKRAGWGGSSH